jgi:hypothetical protein
VRTRINTEPAFDPMTLFRSERPAVATPNSQAVPERRPPMFVAVPDRYPLRGPRISSTAARVTVVTTSAMVVGVLIGFASGYLTSPGFSVPRVTVPGATVPRATAPHAAVPQATVPEAAAPKAAPPAAPATLNPSPSQISATAVNPPSSKATTGGPLSAAPVREPRVPAAAAAITRPQGSIVVMSRPPGADVALDGRVVGQTPMSIPNVTEGMHVLGIELPGFSRWATTVRVEAGEPTRVGASLTP